MGVARRPGMVLALAVLRVGLSALAMLVAAPRGGGATPVAAAHAVPADVPMRVASHAGYTRLVFDFGEPTRLDFHRDGSAVTLDFSTPGMITPPDGFVAGGIHNLAGASFEDGRVVLQLQPGVTVHSVGIGNRRVVDLIDPPGSPPVRKPGVAAVVAPIAARAIAAVALPASVDGVAAAEVTANEPATGTADARAAPVVADTTTNGVPVTRAEDGAPERGVRAPLGIASGPLVLPFAAGTGAAAFRRGNTAVVVFDEPRIIDPATLTSHAGLAGATVQQLPRAVVLRLPLGRGQALSLGRDGTDWSVDFVADGAVTGMAMAVATLPASLHLAADGAAHVVVVPDPQSGDNLVVGTDTLPGTHVAAARHTPQFVLLPTFLGVAMTSLADRATLHTVTDGFVVESGVASAPLTLSTAPADTALVLEAGRLSRSFDLPSGTSQALLRRLHGQIDDAAAAPLLGRLPYRRLVAQTMLALGLGAEAQAVLSIATTDDPRALTDPLTQMLGGAAALLAGRLGETDGLAVPAPPQSDEQRLWRALAGAARLADGAVPDAPMIAAIDTAVPLLLSYPATLQRVLLPLAADTLLRGGDLAAADRLLGAYPGDPALALARAASLQAHGQDAEALLVYDRLAVGRDRSARARAAVAAIDLRVAHGKMTAARAADAGDPLIYAWRGDTRERDLRLKVAAWRGKAGQFRQQLEALREALDVFPEPADGVRPLLERAFSDVVHDDGADRLSPLDLVALVQENTDLLPDGEAGEAMVGKLADRLAALDLPEQASEVLRRLLHDTQAPAAKAAFGSRLAELDLAENQPGPALDALQQSAGAAISPQLAEQRTLLESRAHAALGDRPAALAALAPLADGPALLARAQVHEEAHEWPAAEAALAAYVAQALPAGGKLDAPQSGVVLRLASATAQAGDEAGLARLHDAFGGRLPDANDAALLGVLTASPVRGVGDLPRAARELSAARAVPAELQAMAHR